MLIALTTNNMGLMWVAMEEPPIHRVARDALSNPASLEAGWKYLYSAASHLTGPVRTISCIFAAEKVLGSEGVSALLWTTPECGQGSNSSRPCSVWPSCFLLVAIRHQGRPRAAA